MTGHRILLAMTLALGWAGLLQAQPMLPSDVPRISEVPTQPSIVSEVPEYARWLVHDRPSKVTAGNPDLTPENWQHTWGIVAFDVFPIGQKMAPNGVPYDPLFSLDLLFNLALVKDRSLYLYSNARFWAQKPGEGITNSSQGMLDFSKRQFDLDVGLAWNFYTAFEGRIFAYSDNNLNRGFSLARPYGYNDGFGVECRYYLPTTDFDRGLYRYLSLGYLPTKELIGQDGKLFKPSLFAAGHVAYDFIPLKLYAYTDFEFMMERYFDPRLLIIDPGIAWRPFDHAPNLEFRVGTESTIDLKASYTRSFLYCTARIAW
ncbi:MAG: hypothetical protein U0840_24340 [Gemmataceae bacterium]